MNERPVLRGVSTKRLVAGIVIGLAGIAVLALAVANRRWFDAFIVCVVTVALVLGLRSKPVELAFEVGQHEQHQVMFSFNKFWGNLSITVDGEPAVRDLRMFSLKLRKTYRLSVGSHEVHDVRIEKDRTLLLAGARAQPVRAYVDDVLTAESVA